MWREIVTHYHTHLQTHIYTPPHTHTNAQTCIHTRLLSVSSHKHGGWHKAIPAVDIGALMIVLGVAVCAHVRRRDLVVAGIIPARRGSRVIMLPLVFAVILLIMVSIQVLPETRQQEAAPSSFTWGEITVWLVWFCSDTSCVQTLYLENLQHWENIPLKPFIQNVTKHVNTIRRREENKKKMSLVMIYNQKLWYGMDINAAFMCLGPFIIVLFIK